jgi:2-keto-4-pentenoate hydratase
VAFGKPRNAPPEPAVERKLVVDGDVRAVGRASDDLTKLVAQAARLLAAVGERLQAGDRIITGSIVQVPVRPGDAVVADLGPLGRARLSIARRP